MAASIIVLLKFVWCLSILQLAVVGERTTYAGAVNEHIDLRGILNIPAHCSVPTS